MNSIRIVCECFLRSPFDVLIRFSFHLCGCCLFVLLLLLFFLWCVHVCSAIMFNTHILCVSLLPREFFASQNNIQFTIHPIHIYIFYDYDFFSAVCNVYMCWIILYSAFVLLFVVFPSISISISLAPCLSTVISTFSV